MDQVGLVHVILFCGFMPPLADGLFLSLTEYGLKARNACEPLRRDSNPDAQQSFELAGADAAALRKLLYLNRSRRLLNKAQGQRPPSIHALCRAVFEQAGFHRIEARFR